MSAFKPVALINIFEKKGTYLKTFKNETHSELEWYGWQWMPKQKAWRLHRSYKKGPFIDIDAVVKTVRHLRNQGYEVTATKNLDYGHAVGLLSKTCAPERLYTSIRVWQDIQTTRNRLLSTV